MLYSSLFIQSLIRMKRIKDLQDATLDHESGNVEQAVKHWRIAASAGHYIAMCNLQLLFEQGLVNRDTMNSTLTAYNNSCVEMRSEFTI